MIPYFALVYRTNYITFLGILINSLLIHNFKCYILRLTVGRYLYIFLYTMIHQTRAYLIFVLSLCIYSNSNCGICKYNKGAYYHLSISITYNMLYKKKNSDKIQTSFFYDNLNL